MRVITNNRRRADRLQGRIPALDGVRGLAIALVVISHAYVGVLPFGAPVGVTLFFVLSGYLITGILIRQLDQGRWSLARFYQRRARRLLPGLVVVLATSLFLRLWLEDFQGWWAQAWPVIFYATNYKVMLDGWSSMGHFAHLWSLAVEEHFYLVWPVLLLVLPRKWRERAIVVLVAALGFWRLWLLAVSPDWNRVYLGSDTNAFALLIGGLLACKRFPQLSKIWSWASLLFLIGLSSVTESTMASALLSGAGVLACAALVHTGSLGWRPMELRGLRWLGLISYELYLWQGLTFELPAHWLLQVAAAIGLGWLTWNFIGRRFLQGSSRRNESIASEGTSAVSPSRNSPGRLVGLGAAADLSIKPSKSEG
jgi:peptidoglycan/LPS O-acetylase OafA/YrhL